MIFIKQEEYRTLSLEAIGLLSVMVNRYDCDNTTLDALTLTSPDGKEATKIILDELEDKGYVNCIEGLYHINKQKMIQSMCVVG